ncbi:uncharacterized protein TNCV_352301 [Trichonephila clavipes]|nr:uncharacterized protein TNCV_352301 [Trichonephila clavipes]
MENIRDEFVILLFWCLCDGLTACKTLHRHMIVACQQYSSFENVWKTKIRYPFPKTGRAKKYIEIKDAFHLARAIVYMSQPKASRDHDNQQEEQSHFHINRPLHKHSIATLCTLFPGGIEKLLYEQLKNKNVSSWEKVAKHVPDRWGHLKWGVPIHVTGWKFLNCVIPFHSRYEVTEEETPLYVTLYGNKKLYLKEGNYKNKCWFQQIRDEMYVLSRKQQNMMEEIKNLIQEWTKDQKVLFKSKFNEMNVKYDVIQRERDMFKEERDLMKSKEKEWKIEIDQMKTEIDELKTETMTLKNKWQSMAATDEKLKRMIRNNRKLRMINPWQWKRVKMLPLPAIIQP